MVFKNLLINKKCQEQNKTYPHVSKVLVSKINIREDNPAPPPHKSRIGPQHFFRPKVQINA